MWIGVISVQQLAGLVHVSILNLPLKTFLFILGLLYAYERYKWNAGAKEERLKDQFRSHLEQRLQQVEHVIL